MIDFALVADIPETPPTHFERRIERTPQDTWTGDHSDALRLWIARGFWEKWTSSSGHGTIENLSRMWLDAPSTTSSQNNVLEFLAAMLTAEKRADSVKSANAAENVFELRRLTGFTWSRLAELLNVDRRTLNNWVNGSEIRGANRDHIAETLAVLRFVDRGSAEENAAALDERTLDVSPFEAIKAGQYYNARKYMGHGSSRRQAHASSLSWTGDFEPIVMHEIADGSEEFTRLPDEPKPASRKRRFKRS